MLDTVGGETLERSYEIIKPGGIVVSSAAQPSQEKAKQYGIRAVFFLVEVTTERLTKIAQMIDAGELKTEVGEVLWFDEARQGHEMLEGAPRRRGKIVIKIADRCRTLNNPSFPIFLEKLADRHYSLSAQ